MNADLTPEQKEELQYQILQHYLVKELSTQEIATEMKRLYGVAMTREQVYPAFRRAAKEGMLLIVPPRHQALGKELERVFPNKGDIHVVNAKERQATATVPETGADCVLRLIKELGVKRGGDTVHLGLGVGRSTMLLAQRLGKLMRQDPDVPKLCIHALSTAYSFQWPFANPDAFSGYFSDIFHGQIDWVGLYCEPILHHEHYDEVVRDHKIVSQAFEKAADIDIVVTSLASSEDQHGYLRQYLEDFDDPAALAALNERGWRGDVQLRPYSDRGPLRLDRGMRPVTLFELEELRELAQQEDKHVVLLCSPCGSCPKYKTEAMLPLLTEEALHVWNHLVIDAESASRLLERQRGGERPPAG